MCVSWGWAGKFSIPEEEREGKSRKEKEWVSGVVEKLP